MPNVKKIWFRGGIGDYLICSMLLHPLIRSAPHVEIYMSVPAAVKSTVSSLLYLDLQRYVTTGKTPLVRYVDYDRNWKSVFKERPQHVLNLWNSDQDKIISLKTLAEREHVVPDYDHQIPVALTNPRTPTGGVVFHTDGTSFSGQWPPQRWNSLAQEVRQRWDIKPILVGDHRRCGVAKHCYDLRGCSIFETISIVKQSKCVVACDSCVKNLAFMYNTPCVVLYDLSYPLCTPVEAWFPEYFQKIDYFEKEFVSSSVETIYQKILKVTEAYRAKFES